jgi:hypothetical protein
MVFADDMRVQNTRRGIERVDRGIDAELGDLA